MFGGEGEGEDKYLEKKGGNRGPPAMKSVL